MTAPPEHVRSETMHARLGAVENVFRYGVDYLLIDPEHLQGPLLFSRNRFNLMAVHDRDHGGPRGKGTGAIWADRILRQAGLREPFKLLLLTQPSFLGYVFNPVSFWLAFKGQALIAAVAEVDNTFGDRHCYLCHLPGFSPLLPDRIVKARKQMHVSPFQAVAGDYRFQFNITPNSVSIVIRYCDEQNGVIATLTGGRRPLSNRSIMTASIRRPLGSLRTIILIHWQAMRLYLKRAKFFPRPKPPMHEVTKCYSSQDA